MLHSVIPKNYCYMVKVKKCVCTRLHENSTCDQTGSITRNNLDDSILLDWSSLTFFGQDGLVWDDNIDKGITISLGSAIFHCVRQSSFWWA